jgi:hypothetical protein
MHASELLQLRGHWYSDPSVFGEHQSCSIGFPDTLTMCLWVEELPSLAAEKVS